MPKQPAEERSEKRICAHPGCGTVLNSYNKTAYCFLHQDGICTTFSGPSNYSIARSTRPGSPGIRGPVQAEDWGF